MPIPIDYVALHHGRDPILEIKVREKKSGNITFSLYRQAKSGNFTYIGWLTLEPIYDNLYETHSNICRISELGKGYGLYLYSFAVDYAYQYEMRVASSETPSSLAKRLWKSKTLRKYYKVISRNERFYIKPRQKLVSKIQSCPQ